LTGGQQADSPHQLAKSRAARQGARRRQAIPRSNLLFTSATGMAVVAPAVMIYTVAPRWVGALTVLLLVLTSLIAGIVAAVIPQESSDRVRWWSEWLSHRERMTQRRTGFPADRTLGRHPPTLSLSDGGETQNEKPLGIIGRSWTGSEDLTSAENEQLPEIPPAVLAQRRLQFGRVPPARDDMRVGVLLVSLGV
jgi:hypothetical protein